MTEREQDDRDTSVARLVRLAGTRDVPSKEASDRARRAAHSAWERGVQAAERPRRRVRFVWWPLAMATSGALLVAILVNWPSTSAPAVVANVVAVEARPAMRHEAAESLAAGAPVYEGSTVDTGDRRTAFLLGDSLSLRADRHTQLKFDAVDRVRLLHGSVYVDSGGLNAVSRLRIDTPAGEVRHLGTQFVVTVERRLTRILVREGRVMLTRGGEAPHDIAAGDALEIEGGQVRLLRGLPSHGTDWEWVATAAPVFDIENRPLAEFLAWIAREHGWQLSYRDDSVRAHARDIRLHGSVAGLGIAEMLRRVELITGIPLRVEGGVLEVGGEEVL